jgi:CubicO group peptidase (beta-lactamase class C family)
MRVLFIPCLLLLWTAPAHAQTRSLDAEIPRAMSALDVPGLAIAVVKDDAVVYARGFGVRDTRRSDPVDEHTLFAVGSTTKAFTAAAAGMLVDEGRIAWDDAVVRHLPGIGFHDPYLTREVTIRDLLAHRVGVARADMAWYGNGDVDRATLLSRIEHLEQIAPLRSAMSYNNLLYLAAGELVARVSGRSWDEFIAERFFVPLRMEGSNTTIRALGTVSNVASPHARIDGEVRPVPFRSLDAVAPAGAINSNALQMAQWVRLQLGRGVVDGTRLLSDSVHREVLRPQIVTGAGLGGALSNFAAYGLGWVVQDYRGHRLVWHNGGIDGMHAMVAFLPQQNVGVVVLVNLSGTQLPETLALRVMDTYLGADPGDWIAGLRSAADSATAAAARRQDESRVTGTAPALSPDGYAGRYTSAIYGDATVMHRDGRLTLRYGGATATLEHWHFDTFRVVWEDSMRGPALAAFTFDARGRPATLDIAGLTTFRRAAER